LLNLVSATALDQAKKTVSEIWEKIKKGQYTHDALVWTFGVEKTTKRIDAILEGGALEIPNLDSASNSLRPLTENYGGKIALVKGLIGAVVLITTGLAFFHIVAPWLPLAIGSVYFALFAATVLIGLNYAGAAGPLQWVKGVRGIAEGLAPAGV
jgi:hypothetical protein